MHAKRFRQLTGAAFVLFTMLTGLVMADDRNERKLEGTWYVILRFPASTCNSTCNCPGGQPNIPLPTLNTFLKHGGMVWSGGSLVAGSGQGEWKLIEQNHYIARFKFFI